MITLRSIATARSLAASVGGGLARVVATSSPRQLRPSLLLRDRPTSVRWLRLPRLRRPTNLSFFGRSSEPQAEPLFRAGGSSGGGGWAPASKAALYVIIGANAAVFLLWQNPTLVPTMLRNFALSDRNIREGRLHTMVTHFFSHSGGAHLLMNMLTLWFFADGPRALLSNRQFLLLYMGGGLASGLATLAHNQYLASSSRAHPNAYALGASGAVNALVAFAIAANPRATIYLYFFIPIPAALFGVLFIFKDFLGAVRGGDNIGHAAHLGGAFFGLAFFAAARRGLLRRWR